MMRDVNKAFRRQFVVFACTHVAYYVLRHAVVRICSICVGNQYAIVASAQYEVLIQQSLCVLML